MFRLGLFALFTLAFSLVAEACPPKTSVSIAKSKSVQRQARLTLAERIAIRRATRRNADVAIAKSLSISRGGSAPAPVEIQSVPPAKSKVKASAEAGAE